ncbi:LOW QUALITY PROTEIN: E3 SUMO-protein ligase ZBED1 [Frankliniella fusca]|uniref:E3 SUMO-protein ligase ZBED1 n=1 Tax=Frankliniella fusca TaxID=407009 RepID=A0AAE1HGJ7_9NEOP|nr:LOW QUALITY PROTEIN: E3 SUMO-protein ligase ZBED1 [Frankliniella fusca]
MWYLLPQFSIRKDKPEGRNFNSKCKICHTEISASTTTSRNRKKHLESRHRETLHLLKSTSKRANQHKPQDIRAKMDPDRRSLVSQEVLDEMLIEIVESKLPFMIVERPKFQRLLSKLAPGRKVMGRKTVRARVNAAFEKLKADLRAELAKADRVGATSVAWKGYGRGYLGVTVHWLNPDTLQMRSAALALACRRTVGRQTLDALGTALQDIFQEWGIQGKVSRTVTDNGSNFVKAFRCDKANGDQEEEAADDDVDDDDQDNDNDDDEFSLLDLGGMWQEAEVTEDLVQLPPHQQFLWQINSEIRFVHVSSNDITLMVIASGMRHKLTWAAQLDILKIVHTIYPDRGSEKTDVNYHTYCKDCKVYLGDKTELVQDMQCDFCHKILDVNKSENYFCSFSIMNQCRDLFEGPDDMGSVVLGHRANRQKQKEEALEDIYDGSEYKRYSQRGGILSYPENFSYNFFTDGVPVGNSGKSIWPIYISINELFEKLRSNYIILAGLYIGPSDPNINEFMAPFVKEANRLSSEGFEWCHSGNKITSKAIPMCGIVDSVARPMLLNMHSFHAYSGCTFCYKRQEPTTSNKNLKFVVHGGEKLVNRTKVSLEEDLKKAAPRLLEVDEKKRHYKGIKGPSCLMGLNYFDLCRGVVVDYMHCVLLGVIRSHMTLLFSKKFKTYWELGGTVVGMEDIIKSVDERLLQIKPPKSITRTPESFKRLSSQRASQWRSFVLFYLIVCTTGLLKEEYVNHLSLLSTAMYTLLQKSITVSQVKEAHDLLTCYQMRYQEYFGAENMVYNIHLLSHLCKGVLRFGPLWGHNAFPFEGQNRYILQMRTSPFNVVKQVSRRYMLNRSFPSLCVKLSSGDRAIDFCEDTLERQLKCFVYNAECVLVGKGNAVLLTDEECVCVKHYSEENFVNFRDTKTTLTFRSMIVKGFRVSGRATELLSCTRNINSYVNIKKLGFACIEKIIFYKSEDEVYRDILWDEDLVVAACLEPIFKLDWMRATVQSGNGEKAAQARDWLRRAATEQGSNGASESDGEGEGDVEDPDEVQASPAKRRRKEIPTTVRQLFSLSYCHVFEYFKLWWDDFNMNRAFSGAQMAEDHVGRLINHPNVTQRQLCIRVVETWDQYNSWIASVYHSMSDEQARAEALIHWGAVPTMLGNHNANALCYSYNVERALRPDTDARMQTKDHVKGAEASRKPGPVELIGFDCAHGEAEMSAISTDSMKACPPPSEYGITKQRHVQVLQARELERVHVRTCYVKFEAGEVVWDMEHYRYKIVTTTAHANETEMPLAADLTVKTSMELSSSQIIAGFWGSLQREQSTLNLLIESPELIASSVAELKVLTSRSGIEAFIKYINMVMPHELRPDIGLPFCWQCAVWEHLLDGPPGDPCPGPEL